MKTPSDPSRPTVRIRRSWLDTEPDQNTDPTPQRVFDKNRLTLDDRHLEALAKQIADGVQARLAAQCNCLDDPNLREVVTAVSMQMMREVIAHQRRQAAIGFE
jgi:hypothetical protein